MSTAPASGFPPELLDALSSMGTRWRSIAAFGLIGCVAGAAVAWRTPLLYQATADVRLVQDVQQSLQELGLDITRDAPKVVSFLYSIPVREAAAARGAAAEFGISPDAPDAAERWAAAYLDLVTIAPAPSGEVIWVMVRHHDSARAATLANLIAEVGGRLRREEIRDKLAEGQARNDARRARILQEIRVADATVPLAVGDTVAIASRRSVLVDELWRLDRQALLIDRFSREPFEPWILQGAAAPHQGAFARERALPVLALAGIGLVLGALLALLRGRPAAEGGSPARPPR